MSIPETWIETDEAEDVAGSIRQALRCREAVRTDGQAWKWVALALHSALQGACVCHLVGTTGPVGAVTERNAGEWLNYLNGSRSIRPRTYLMALPDLLKAARKPNSAGDRSNVSGLPLSDAELAWLSRFHESIRNEFVHFEPKGWSIEISGIPALAELIAKLIRDISNMNWAFRHKDRRWIEALKSDLASLSEWPAAR